MEELLSELIIYYLAVGGLVTLYVVVFFVLTGVTFFDQGAKQKMPFRYKVSYLMVMLILLPYFYAVFGREIACLWSDYRSARQSATSRMLRDGI